MARPITRLTACVLILFAPAVATADTWKCITADGEVQYTAVPPTGERCEKIEVSGDRSTASPAPLAPTAPNATAPPVDPATGNVDADILRIKAENCRRARENIQLLESANRIRIKDGEEHRILSDAERESKLKLAREQEQINCQP